MSSIAQPIRGDAFPHDPVRRGHHDRGAAAPLAEMGAGGPAAFAPWLARARAARLLTEHL